MKEEGNNEITAITGKRKSGELSYYDTYQRTEPDTLLAGFSEWLRLLGYADTSVRGMTSCARELFLWCRSHDKDPRGLREKDLQLYFFHLRSRPKKKQGPGALSAAQLRKHLHALQGLGRYLMATERGYLELPGSLELPAPGPASRPLFSKREIAALYGACTGDAMGLRDKAMLGVFYGCGLRRSEGTALDTMDLLVEKGLLHVRKGKGGRERSVPLPPKLLRDLETYLLKGRPQWEGRGKALFPAAHGGRLSDQGHRLRLRVLCQRAGIGNGPGLHGLRRSVATHLLAGGMGLERVARFLGHRSLGATQLYAKVKEELNGGL